MATLSAPSDPAAPTDRAALVTMRRVLDRIDREFASPLNLEELARGVHVSAGHLSREFRRVYGESPSSYLVTRRIERAMTLLRRGDLSVTEGIPPCLAKQVTRPIRNREVGGESSA